MLDHTDRVDAALAWAARGIAVLPIRAGGKAPLVSRGLHDATTSPTTIRQWWDRWPTANIAIATGHPGVDVLDVDVRGDRSGWAALRKLRGLGIVPDGAPAVQTPSGGIHLYFVGTVQRNGSLHAEHLDFRSSGGYALVPPSTVITDTYSGTYRWERSGELISALDWQALTTALRPTPPQAEAPPRRPLAGWDVHTLAAAVERVPVGNRNNMLFWAFCEGLRSGYDLRVIAEAGLRSGQTAHEVQATWRQAVKRVATDGQAGPSPAKRSWAVPSRSL